jgi:hypothetical protein
MSENNTLVVSEEEAWQALQLDLEPNADSPPSLEPIDRAFVLHLIKAATKRLERLCFVESINSTLEGGEIPADLKQAALLDISTHYFSRTSPELPDDYWALILPFRRWSFGG